MISIVIPIFNETETLKTLKTRIVESSVDWNEDFEVVLVDDGSYDNSFELMRKIALEDRRFKIVRLSRNFGHQPAITAGIKHAKGDAVVIMDGDLQDPPELISSFIEYWKKDYQVVYGVRKNRKESFLKRFLYKTFYRFFRLISNIKMPLDSGDFCLMDRKVVRALVNDIPEHHRFLRGLRAYAGFKQTGVEYDRDSRYAGKAKYTYSKLVGLAMDGVLDFSTFPLRIASYMGFFVSFLSFFTGVFFIVHRVLNFKILGYSPADVPGLASLAVGIFFLGGIILIILGIMGEYLGRIYFEVKRRPFYIIDEVYEHEGSE